MGILARFKDIMSSNVNALLDKMEDPAKMIDQLLRNLQSELGEVKAETAGVMAQEAAAKRELDACQAEVNKLYNYATKAVAAGNDADAAVFLQKKALKSEELASLQQAYNIAASNSMKMRQMFDHLNQQIQEMESKKAQIKAKISVAKTQEKINKLTEGVSNVSGKMNKFDQLEKKADQMLDKANAMADLNAATGDPLGSLMEKYDTTSSINVDDELAALKAKMGMSV